MLSYLSVVSVPFSMGFWVLFPDRSGGAGGVISRQVEHFRRRVGGQVEHSCGGGPGGELPAKCSQLIEALAARWSSANAALPAKCSQEKEASPANWLPLVEALVANRLQVRGALPR